MPPKLDLTNAGTADEEPESTTGRRSASAVEFAIGLIVLVCGTAIAAYVLKYLAVTRAPRALVRFAGARRDTS